MASYKIYFLNFCHQNHSLEMVERASKLHFATLWPCFIKKVKNGGFPPWNSWPQSVEHTRFYAAAVYLVSGCGQLLMK